MTPQEIANKIDSPEIPFEGYIEINELFWIMLIFTRWLKHYNQTYY